LKYEDVALLKMKEQFLINGNHYRNIVSVDFLLICSAILFLEDLKKCSADAVVVWIISTSTAYF
jgi:hypothetical protein